MAPFCDICNHPD